MQSDGRLNVINPATGENIEEIEISSMLSSVAGLMTFKEEPFSVML